MKRHFDDWINSYLQYTENSEPPQLYKEWVAVSVIAAVLQRKCVLEWGDILLYPNMYIVLVGPSGRCRKGTAMSVGAGMLRELGIKMAAEAITREALIQELNSAESWEGNEAGELTAHSSLTIYSPELVVFLGYDNKSLISDLTDWYDCRERWTYRTKNMGTDDIINVWVNLIGATTPELIQSTLPRDAIGGGLASRIVFVFEEKKSRSVPLPFSDTNRDILKGKLVEDLEKIHMMSGKFKIAEDFIDPWVTWYMEQETNPPFFDDKFSGYNSRRPTHVLKLCMILSASSRTDMVIDKEVLERAVNLLERTEVKMPYVFSGVGSARDSDVFGRIMAHIRSKQETSFSQILRVFHSDLDGARHLSNIIETLKEMDYARTITTPEKGETKIIASGDLKKGD